MKDIEIDPYDTNYLFLGINIDKKKEEDKKNKYIENADPYSCNFIYINKNKDR